jgi:hypothetical protein
MQEKGELKSAPFLCLTVLLCTFYCFYYSMSRKFCQKPLFFTKFNLSLQMQQVGLSLAEMSEESPGNTERHAS